MRFTLLFLAAVSLWGVAGLRAADLSSTARIDTLDQQIRITGNRFVETVHSRKTILMAAGRDFGRLVVSETPFQKITSLELLVQDASGRTITKIHKKDMTKFCGFGASYELYNDNCTFVYHPQVASYPYSIVVNYEIECSSLFFLTGVEIPRDIPVSFAQVVLDCESDRPVRYKAYHLDVSPVVTRSQNREISTWVIQNLEAEKEWLSLPPEWVGGSSIRMAASQFGLENFGCQPVTWRNLGRFYAALSESRYLSPTGTSSPREHDAAVAVCDSLYRSVVDGTRYVAVSIGLSGWQPQAAEKTERVG